MKLSTVLVLVGLCAVALATPTTHKYKVADKDFLLKQKNIFRLFFHVNQPNTYQDQVEYSKTWKFEDHLDHFTNIQAVKEFLAQYRFGMLPRGEIFSVMYEKQRHEVVSLFHVFYYAKDFETFYKVACWARDHVNEGMFVYAMTVAVLHRPDCHGIVLPPAYEIYPYYFVNTEVIQKAYEYKMRNYVGVKHENDVVIIPYNYTGWYLDVSPEQKLSYFTEDIGLNSYYYYFHADYPFWMGGEQYGLKKDHRGELYYFVHQQILARYYLERLSNGLGKIHYIDWRHPVKIGYEPSLRHQNGLDFNYRPNFAHTIKDDYSYVEYERIQMIEMRISSAIDAGFVITEDGSKVPLTTEKGLDILGNLIAGTKDSINRQFYSYLHVYCRMLLGFSGKPLHRYQLSTGALEHYETALRDPAFYRIYKKIIYYFQKYKSTLPRYTYAELGYQGVKVESVEIDHLYTYFDHFDVDITNALYTDLTKEFDKEPKIVKTRMSRLNHKPFTYKVNVQSDKAGKVVVRAFLGPKYDEFGRFINIEENRLNFIQLDKYVYDLKSGKNVIERNSRDFYRFVKDRTSYRELYRKVLGAYEGGDKFVLDQTEAHCGFPNRLILPKGRRGGMTFQFYVIVTPYHETPEPKTYDDTYWCGVGTGQRYFDTYPMGFPFDRPIDEYAFYTPNMYFYDVDIYHKHEDELNVVGH